MNALIEGGKFIIHTTYVRSMSEEGESINENINQSSNENPSRVPEYEGETVSPVTEMEEKGVEETATEEPLEEQAEQSDTSAFKQPSSQLEVEANRKQKL
jgi:hypothetical protein